MNYLLHGNNIVASRKELVGLIDKAKEEGLEIVRLDGRKVLADELVQPLESTPMLAKGRLLVLENFLSQGKKTSTLINQIEKSKPSHQLIFWEPKSVTAPTLKKLVKLNLRVQEFKIPPLVFRFLDSLAPGNSRYNLQLFHQTIEVESVEIVFYLLARQVRLLILAKDGQIDSQVPSWKANKLFRQAESFEEKQLLKLYRRLLEIDFSQKSGRATLPLSSQLDLLLASL